MTRNAYDRRTFRGVTLNERTIAMIKTAERGLGFALGLTQGSYNAGGVSASGGTHDGGGAVDFSVSSYPMKKRLRVQHAMRRVGFADWDRPALVNEWPTHNHGIAIGDKEVAPEAWLQVQDYYAHGNGLYPYVGHDDVYPWRPDPIPVFDYQAYLDRQETRKRIVKVRDRIGELLREIRATRRRIRARRERIDLLRKHR
jgi:hypothetical protein